MPCLDIDRSTTAPNTLFRLPTLTLIIVCMQKEQIPSPFPDDPLPIGEQFKQLRQAKSLLLEDAAAATKIARANLQAIEAMEYDKLPADPFLRGQIILYGNFLGMDGRLAADRFIIERDGDNTPASSALLNSLSRHSLAPKKLAEPTHISSATLAVILLTLIIVSFTGFCLYFSWNPFAFLTGKALPLSTTTTTTFHPADPATGNGNGQPTKALQVDAFFRQDDTIIVTIDNKPTVTQQQSKGATARWEADQQILLEFSLPDSAELQLNGMPAPFPENVNGRYTLRLPASPSTP